MNENDYMNKLTNELEKFEKRQDRQELFFALINTLKKMLFFITKKIFILLFILALIFIVINTIIFTSAYQEALKKEYYPDAKAYLACADLINEMYIFPLSNKFRWDHPITKPFYKLRNKLYNIGLSKLPPGEGEREVWWYEIRYKEFREVVESCLVEYGLKKKPRKFLFEKVNDFIAWNNELYEHIELIAKANISDKTYKEQKLFMFITLARLAEAMERVLEGKLEEERQIKKGIFKGNHIYQGEKFVKKFDKAFLVYKDLIKSSKESEKDSYRYIFDNPKRKIWDSILRHDYALSILQSKYFVSKTFSCNDKYLKIFADAQKEIRTYYYANRENLSFGMGQRLGMSTLSLKPFIAYECRYNPELQDYVNYSINEYIKGYKHHGFVSKKMEKLIKEFNKN